MRLDVDGAAQSVNRARELRQQPVTRRWLSKIIPVDPQLNLLRGQTDFQELQKRLEADAQSPS
jgi:hypothetical protein